jgi:hypothetical protein
MTSSVPPLVEPRRILRTLCSPDRPVADEHESALDDPATSRLGVTALAKPSSFEFARHNL